MVNLANGSAALTRTFEFVVFLDPAHASGVIRIYVCSGCIFPSRHPCFPCPTWYSNRPDEHATTSYLLQAFRQNAAAVAAAAGAVGSIAWYTHLYGTLPFLPEVHASSPGELGLHPAAYPWSHKGALDSFDHGRYVESPELWRGT